MKYRLLKNRNLVEDKEFLNKNKWFVGYDKENRAEILEFEIPDTLNDYAKKINFDLGTEKVSDILDQDNTYILKNNITQYKQVSFYLEFIKEIDNNTTEILKTEVKTIEFGDSFDVNTEITEEEISIIDTLIAQTNSAINRANAISQDLENKVATDYYRGATGEKGDKGDKGDNGQDGHTPEKGVDYFTPEDIENLNIPSKTSDLINDSGFISNTTNNLVNYTLKTNTGSLIDLEINQTTYVVTLSLKDVDGNIISTDTIDLPLENVVVSGAYDSTNQKIVLTLQSGDTVDIPVGALVSGLQSEITSQNKLASDLVDDTNSGNKFVTTSEKQTWNNKLDSSALANYVTNTDYATAEKGGTIRISNASGLGISNGNLYAVTKAYNTYNSASGNMFIGKGTLENVITGKGLVSNTDYATYSNGGVIKVDGAFSTFMTDGKLKCTSKTYEDYQNLSLYAFIGKGTLENVLIGKGLNRIVTLTQQEYDALVTKDSNTYYYIVEE